MYVILCLLSLGGIAVIRIAEFIQQMIVDARVRQIMQNEKEIREKVMEDWGKQHE